MPRHRAHAVDADRSLHRRAGVAGVAAHVHRKEAGDLVRDRADDRGSSPRPGDDRARRAERLAERAEADDVRLRADPGSFQRAAAA